MQRSQKRPPAKPVNQGPQQVRIIGGIWKRTPLPVLNAEGLRPTPDRVRETVFNWLNHLLDGDWQRVACLDLFAGAGALGFEAASRGAAKVVMVEDNPAAVRQLEVVKTKLKAEQVSIQTSDEKLRAKFKDRMDLLKVEMDENIVRLKAAIEASRRRIEAVMLAIREQVSDSAPYTPVGRATRTMTLGTNIRA